MERATRLVLHGMMELSTEERRELIAEWNRYVNSPGIVASGMIRETKTFLPVTLGPLGGPCKCCGR